MRKIGILALLLGLLMAPAAWAQGGPQQGPGMGPGGPGGMHRGMRRGGGPQAGILGMAQQLNLTQNQQTQIGNLLQTQRQQAQSIRQDTSLTPEQKQEKINQLRQSTHKQVLGLLTPEQQSKLKQLQKGRGGMAALNLTPDQKSKLQPIRQQMRQQVQAVRQDSSLTPQQKRDKIREIRQDAMAQMNAILTPEQQQQQMQQRRQRRGQPEQAPPPPPPQGL